MMEAARLEQRMDRMESDVSDMRSDVADMRADIKALLAAHNMGKGFWFTAKVGAALLAAGAAIATILHIVFDAKP